MSSRTKERFPAVKVPNTAGTMVNAGREQLPERFERKSQFIANDPQPIVPRPGYETPMGLRKDLPPERLLGMKTIEIPLDTAYTQDAPMIIDVVGNLLWINYSTNSSDRIRIKANDLSDFQSATRGWSMAGIQFNKLRIAIPNAVANAVLELSYCFDPFQERVRVQ